MLLICITEFSLDVRENKTDNMAVIKYESTFVIMWNDKGIISSPNPYLMRNAEYPNHFHLFMWF